MSREQTVFFWPIDPRDENHKDPEGVGSMPPLRGGGSKARGASRLKGGEGEGGFKVEGGGGGGGGR